MLHVIIADTGFDQGCFYSGPDTAQDICFKGITDNDNPVFRNIYSVQGKVKNAFIRFIGTVMIQFPVLITILLIVNGAK